MKHLLTSGLLVIALLLGISLTGYGQNNLEEDDDLLTKKEKTIKDYTSKIIHQQGLDQATNNNATVVQNGAHESIVNQIHTGGVDPNVVFVEQNGAGNTSDIRQNGSGNTSVIDQNGSDLNYRGEIIGNNNTTTLTQTGSRNSFEHEIIGDNKVYNNVQHGSGNSYSISDLSNNGAAPQIIQEGHNMNLRIEVR